MKFVCYSAWEQLPDSANALFTHAEQQNIFYSRPWFESLCSAVLDDEHQLLLACVETEDRILAILPLLRSSTKTWYALKHRYTPHYSLLLADEDQTRVLGCLAEGLRQLPLDGLLLEPVADTDQPLNALKTTLEACGFHCDYLFRHYNWIHRVQDQSFAEYMAGRPAKLRNTIARKQRKLAREHGYHIKLFRGAAVPEAMADYYAVYSASWKANEQYIPFVDEMVARFSRPGWTRLAVLYIQGKPVAAQLWFVLHGKASIFRLAYDEVWKPYSPGSILTHYLMEYVIDTDKVKEIDFLTGNEAYKQDWMSERRTRYALVCIRQVKTTGRYRQFVDTLKRMVKRPT